MKRVLVNGNVVVSFDKDMTDDDISNDLYEMYGPCRWRYI